MEADDLIPASAFCNNYHVEISFLYSLQQHGMLDVVVHSEEMYIRSNELPILEKLTRLHYELDINLEGMEAIVHLLDRVENMQHEIAQLKNKLRLYEE
jgi:hypothetical protein